MDPSPKPRIVAPPASPEEAAAVVAALEQFMRDTAPKPVPAPLSRHSAWARAALLEGAGHHPGTPSVWGAPGP